MNAFKNLKYRIIQKFILCHCIILAYFHKRDLYCPCSSKIGRALTDKVKAISTNNSNYTSPLLKCDKLDNVAFIESIMLTGSTSFFYLSLIPYGLSEDVKTDSYD